MRTLAKPQMDGLTDSKEYCILLRCLSKSVEDAMLGDYSKQPPRRSLPVYAWPGNMRELDNGKCRWSRSSMKCRVRTSYDKQCVGRKSANEK